MSDSLPTICADQLTKAVNLAAAGTLTALDEENEDEEQFKGKGEQGSSNKALEPSSPLSTLKLLEALSSSMTSNLSKLSQLDSNNPPAPLISSNGGSSIRKSRQRSFPAPSAAPPPQSAKKYSNRKNYKLLPPVIPSQIGAGVKKMRPSAIHPKQKLLTLGPRLQSVPSSDLIGLQIRPVSVAGSGVVLVSPPKLPNPSNKPESCAKKTAFVSPALLEKNIVSPKVGISNSQVVQSKGTVKMSPSMTTTCSTIGSTLKTVTFPHMSVHSLSSLQPVLKLQPATHSPQHHQAITMSQNSVKHREALPINNIGLQNSEGLSKPDPIPNQGIHAMSAFAAIATPQISSKNNSSQSANVIETNKNSSVPSPVNEKVNLITSTTLRASAVSSKDFTPVPSKSIYVPILPQPATANASEKAGQLIFQNSCLQMLHPNGSLQTLAVVHPQVLNSATTVNNQSLNKSFPPLNSVKSSLSLTLPPADLKVTAMDTSQPNIKSTTFLSLPSNAKTIPAPVLSGSNSILATSDAMSSAKLLSSFDKPCVKTLEYASAISNTSSVHKTVLATVIAGPPRGKNTQGPRAVVPPSTSASPSSSALQCLARLLAPKELAESAHLPSVITLENERQPENERELFIKQASKNDVGIRINSNEEHYTLTSPKILNTVSSTSTSIAPGKIALSPNLPSALPLNHKTLLSNAQSSLSSNIVKHASCLSSSQQSLDFEYSVSSQEKSLNDAESESASATAVAAAAMMSLAQTADPITRFQPLDINQESRNVDCLLSLSEANNFPLRIPSKTSSAEPTLMASRTSVSSQLPSIASHVATQGSPSLAKAAKSPSQPHFAKQFSEKFLMPSTCGKKMIVSPHGIRHLQSILRQRGVSEGYFVITSPRVTQNSPAISTIDNETPISQKEITSHSCSNQSSPKEHEFLKRQTANLCSPQDKESLAIPVDEGTNDEKYWPTSETVQSEVDQDARDENFECDDSDNASCTSRSSSSALVIETGEDEEQDEIHRSPISNKDTCSSDHVHDRQSDAVEDDQERDENSAHVNKTKATEALSTYSEEPVLDKIPDNPCIPQSPLSLSDLVRQQASRNLLLNNKDPDICYFKSPGSTAKDVFDGVRDMSASENNGFTLPAPVSHIPTSTNEQSLQSPVDTDMASDYRQGVFTPGSLLPVDLSYERDSQLAGVSRTENESILSPSPPKVAVTSTSVLSPRSPFIVSGGITDHSAPLNPPMTPNTMLINLLNRVPTPLLTNNQELLTLPTSQENRPPDTSNVPRLRRALPEKRGENLFLDKSCPFNDSQEFADDLADNNLFSENRKSTDGLRRTYEPPQNALEMIASNYTVVSIANESASIAVTEVINFPVQSMAGESFGRSSYTVNNHSVHDEFTVDYPCHSSSQKACQDSMPCCDHLLVTVNLDSDTPAYAIPMPHSHEECTRAKQSFSTGCNVNYSHYLTRSSDHLHCNFNSATEERAQASQHLGKSADTDILRHLVMSTNTSSYHSQSAVPSHPNDTPNGNFNLIDHQQEQCQQQTLSQFPCRVNSFLINQSKALQPSSAQQEQSSAFSDHGDSQYSHSVQGSSQPPCTFSDSSISFKKTAYHCAISSSQINEPLHMHDSASALEGLHNLSFVSENISKSSMPISHGFEPTGDHLQHFHSETDESSAYFDHTHQQASLQSLRQDSDQHFHPSEHQGLSSYEHDQSIQSFGQTNPEANLTGVYEQSSQVYGQTSQESLQAYDQNDPQSNLQAFNQNDQQKGLQEFRGIEHDGNLHSFSTAKHPSNIQPYDQHPDPHGISYNLESLPPAPPQPGAPPDHRYSSSAMSHQDSSRMFAPHPDQVNYLVDQQYPAAPPAYFTSSTSGGVDSTIPSLFSEQCAIGSEAPVLGTSNNHHSHPCGGSFSDTSQGLQHMQQQYPYPSNQSGGDSLAVSGSHHHPGHEVEENSGSLEKQPVLPSASFSPPSVADQAASQAAAAAAAEAGGEEHHYSGTFPNLSIYDLYLRGSNAEARSGANETETLSGNFCVECNTMYKTQCKFHSCEYTYVTDTPILSHARLTLPSCLTLGESTIMGHTNNTGVFAKEKIAVRTKFGPLTGSPVSCDKLGSTRSFSLWQTFMGGNVKVMDSSDENSSNWLMFVKPARVSLEQNLVVFQHGHSVYFVTRQEIQPQQELLYWFAKDYARILGITGKSKSAQHMLCPHCSICKRIFPDRKELRSHLRLQHPRPCNKQCNQCSKRFSQVSHLKAHIASVHSQVKRFVCTQCGKRFSDSSNFKKHAKLHTKERAFKCQLCGRDFRQKSHLKSHMNTHMPVKNEQCGFCGERFTRAFTRRQHELQHTKQNKIQCEHCGKVFYKQKIYKHHLKIHRDERNYPCLQCHRSFRTRGNLLRHGPACKQRKCLPLPSCHTAPPSGHTLPLPQPPPPLPPHLPTFRGAPIDESIISSSPMLSQSHPIGSSLHDLPDSDATVSLPPALDLSPDVSQSHMSLQASSLARQGERQPH